MAVDNVDGAVAFLQSLTDASVVSEPVLPSTRADAVNMVLADTTVQVVAAGQRHSARHGDGIQSCVFGVRDLELARSYFHDVGIELSPCVDPETVAVALAGDTGLLFEFVECS
jgi:hypothetical protein